MATPSLDGCKVAILVENKFIPEEIEAYRIGFSLMGAHVEFISRLWYGSNHPARASFYSDVDPLDNHPWETPHVLTVEQDISTINMDDYAAILMSANYTSVRLRYMDLPKQLRDFTDDDISSFDPHAHVQEAPVVKFFADAMKNKRLVKGLLCHGLWVLTPNPRLLRGRNVICHTVVMADVLNCGAQIRLNRTGVVKDADLVTGFSKHEVLPFISAVAEQVVAIRNQQSYR